MAMLLLGGASAQQVSVKGYHLTTEEPVLEARPAEGWTWFQIPEGKDTIFGTSDTVPNVENLLWDYLLVDAAPEALAPGKYQEKKGYAIGFDFPFAGKMMKCFGLTGNGALFLGAEDTVTAFYMNNLSARDSNVVWLMPRLMRSSNPNTSADWKVEADAQTRIGYCSDAANGCLWIAFENLLLPANGEVYRWSYDVLLHEDGNIQVDFRDVETMEPTPTDRNRYYFGFTLALKAHNGDNAVYASDWESDLSSTNRALAMSGAYTDATLTMLYPEPCERPEGVTASARLSLQLARELTVTLTVEGVYDGFVAFMADNDQVEAKPEDGKVYQMARGTYQAGDSIGDYLVRLSGSTEFSFTADGLEPATSYYVYVWAYNDRCLDAPKYAAEPEILEVATLAGPPAAVLAGQTGTTASLQLEGLASGEEVLVGIAMRDYQFADNLLDVDGKVWERGDTIYSNPSTGNIGSTYNHGPYLVQVAYSGKVENGSLMLEGLEPATPYYLYIWNKLGDTTYTMQYARLPLYTVATIDPHTTHVYDFANDFIPSDTRSGILPAGWGRSDESASFFYVTVPRVGERTDQTKSLHVSLSEAGAWADAISPVFKMNYAVADVHFRLQRSSRSALAQWQDGDTLFVYYKKADESLWQPLETLSAGDALEYGDGNFAEVSMQMQGLTVGEGYQLRFKFSSLSGSRMSPAELDLNRVEIEPSLPCAYPIHIAVNDSLTTHRVIGVDFVNDNTLDGDVIFRSRAMGETEWSDWAVSEAFDYCRATHLQPQTVYELALQTVCSTGDSSLVRVVEAVTYPGLPYAKDLADLPAVPEDMAAYSSMSLPEEGDAELELSPSYFSMARSEEDGQTAVGAALYNSSYIWLTLPAICLEDVMAPAQYSFSWKAYTLNRQEQTLENYLGAAQAYVFVSPDASFSVAEIADTLGLADKDTLASGNKAPWKKCVLDLSAYSRHVHVAIALNNPATEISDYDATFVLDSLRAVYTDGVPCFAVEDVRQYGLQDDQITLSWLGTSWEYAIYLTNTDLGETDTVYTTETEHTITGLAPGCLYEYAIQSFCEPGHQSPGPVVSDAMFWFETNEACVVPTGFVLIDSAWNSVTVVAHSETDKQVHVWAEDRERYPNVDNYYPWPAGRDTLLVSGLDDELHIRYNIAIRSICSASAGDTSVWSDTLRFTTPEPQCGQPAGLKAEAAETSAVLSWTAGAENDAYRLVWNAVSESAADTLEIEETSHSLEGLRPGTAYVWAVQGVCDGVLYSFWVESKFDTRGTANETADQLRFGVRTSQDRIMILNPARLPIDRVEVYAATGKLLYGQEFGVRDNVLLPVLPNASEIVLVRIVSEGKAEVYKMVLL